jgi:hypothetical protein
MHWTEDDGVDTNWTEGQLLFFTTDRYDAIRPYIERVSTGNVIGNCTDKIKLIIHTGQSLSIGGGSNQIVESAPRYPEYCQMLADGARGFASFAFLDAYTVEEVIAFAADKLITDAPDFLPIQEESSITRGETQGSGMLERLHKRELNAEVQLNTYVYRSHGRGGADISLIEKGAPPYYIGLEEVRRVKDIAAIYGKEVEVVALVITHGEADTDNPTYDVSLTQLIADYRADVPLITGQTTTIPVFIDQVAPANPDGLQTAIQEMQVAVADALDGVYLTAPKYQYAYVAADNVHLAALSYRLLGDLQGYVISQVLQDGIDWVPLKPISWSVSDTIITVVFNVPSGSLAFDTTTLAAAPDYGFTVIDGGEYATISDVSLTAYNTMQITLAAPLSGEAKALKYVEGGADYQHGNLRDSQNLLALIDGSNIYNWCVAFNKSLYLPYEEEVAAIPDMKAWVNAGNGNTTLDGGSQVVLTDLSPEGADWSVPAGVTTGPVITPDTLNGYPVLTFNGVGSGVGGLQRSVSDLPITIGAATFFVVSRRTALDSTRQYTLAANTRTDSFVMEYANNNTQLAAGINGTLDLITQDPTVWDIWAVSYDNDTLVYNHYTKTNGVQQHAMPSVTTVQTLFMGQNGATALGFKGDIAEVLVFYRDLFAVGDEAYLASIINYLSAKYGI